MCLGASGSVRATSMHHLASWASVVHTFWPVTTQSPLSLTALVFSDARSEPDVGLGEALAPDLLGGQDRLQVALLLLLAAVRDHHRAAHDQAEHVGGAGRLGARQLLAEDGLLDQRRAPAAVLLRPRQPRVARRVQLALPLLRNSKPRPRRSGGSSPGWFSASQPRTSSRNACSLGESVRSTGRAHSTGRAARGYSIRRRCVFRGNGVTVIFNTKRTVSFRKESDGRNMHIPAPVTVEAEVHARGGERSPSWPSAWSSSGWTTRSSTWRCPASRTSSAPRRHSCSGWSTPTCWSSPGCCSGRHPGRPVRAQARPACRARVFGRARRLGALAGRSGPAHRRRRLMGIGGAFIMPTTLSISRTCSRPRSGQGDRHLGGHGGIGIGLGPITGGLLLEPFPWASVFLVNLPVAVVAHRWPRSARPGVEGPEASALDPVGACLSTAGPSALVYGIIEAAAARGDPDRPRRARRLRGPAGRVRPLGAAHAQPMLDVGFSASRASAARAADRAGVLRPVRVDLLPDAVPPVRAWPNRDRGRRRAARSRWAWWPAPGSRHKLAARFGTARSWPSA